MATTYSSTDVLIVGAGPVGLTLALDLARRGVSCRIIDRLSEYPIGTRARGVSARTQEVFADLNVLEPLLAYAERPFPSRYYDQDGHIVRETAIPVFSPTPDRPYPGNLIISQQHTEMVLRECLATYGIYVELDCSLTDLTQNAEHVTAFVHHAGKSEEIRARYLVGCDGGNSTVRKRANITFLGETLGERHMLFGNLSVEGIDPNYWHFWSHPTSGLLSLNPMPLSDTWFFTAPIEPDEHGMLPEPSLEIFQQIFNERVGGDGIRFYNPVYLSIYRLNVRMVDRFRNGRVFLAGDAAHVHAPAGGQGMNTGIQDAYNLGWKLAYVLSGGPEPLLDTYHAERLPIAQQVLSSTTARIRSWGQPDTSGKSAGVENMSRMIQGKDAFGDITQLNITYRGSTLAHDLDETTGIRAGDRAPDALCLDAQSKEPHRLFDIFTGTHFTLLVFGDQPVPQYLSTFQRYLHVCRISQSGANNGQDLIDAHGYAYQNYGITDNALILVRPDGYVGLTGQHVDAHQINAYLSECIG